MIKKELLEYQKFLKLLGKTKTELEILSRSKEVKYNFIVFAIDMKREKLYDRINKRVDKMIEEGLVDEVINLKEKYSYLTNNIDNKVQNILNFQLQCKDQAIKKLQSIQKVKFLMKR